MNASDNVKDLQNSATKLYGTAKNFYATACDLYAVYEKISSSEFVKNAKKVAEFLGPLGEQLKAAVDIFQESEAERLERNFKEINLKLDEVNLKLDKFGDALSDIGSKVNSASKQISSDIKFQNFNQYYINIKASISNLNKNILTFTGSKDDFLKKLDQFVEDYEKKLNEDQLIRLAIEDIAGQSSLISTYISVLLDEETNNKPHVISSTIQSVYEFYSTIFNIVSRGDAMMNLCYTLQNQLRDSENPRFKRRSSLTNELVTSMINSLEKLVDLKHRYSFLKINSPIQEVKFKNVIQYFWQNENELSGSTETCTDDCEHFVNRRYSNDGCYGYVRDCEFKISVFKGEHVYPVS